MPNVLIIVQNLPVPFDRRVWQESTTLKRAGYGVTVISPASKAYRKRYERLEGIDIYRYPLFFEADDGVLAYLFEFAYCWLATFWLALVAYRKSPFQVIHACNPPDIYFVLAMMFRPLGVKFVFDYHDLCPELYVAKGHKKEGVILRLLLFLERMTLRTADLVIATNESYREIAAKRGGIPGHDIVVVRSGPRREWATPCCPDPRMKLEHKYLAVFVGQIGKQDGIDYLLQAASVYRRLYGNEILFAVIGSGPLESAMRNLASAMGLNDSVHFTGRICDEELRSYLATADFCVDPDPWTEFNNLSTMNKVIEYMAFGKPIVAFDLLESRRSAGDAARFVEPNDVAKFASAMHELLQDEMARAHMSETGKERFEHQLSWETSEQKLLQAYESLVSAAELAQTGLDRASPDDAAGMVV